MSVDSAADAIGKLGGPLEALGWLEESITFGRARWVLLDDGGRSATITMTLTGNGEPSVLVHLDAPLGEDGGKPIEIASKADTGLLAGVLGSTRINLEAAVEFVLTYARLLAFRPSATPPTPPLPRVMR